MKKMIKRVLSGIGLAVCFVSSANAAQLSGVPYWTFTQDYTNGEMYFFVNVGPGQIAYYIGDNHAIATMVDNAGHAGKSINVNVDAGSKITQVGGPY